MKRGFVVASVVVSAVAAVVAAPWPARAGGVNLDINIGVPFPPPIVVEAPPRLVVVPGSPVHYAPSLPADVFVYRGHYYRHHHHAWFRAPHYHGPWRNVGFDRVPRHVRAVPVHYYKIPPGHLRKMEQGRGGHWKDGHHRHGGGHGRRDRD